MFLPFFRNPGVNELLVFTLTNLQKDLGFSFSDWGLGITHIYVLYIVSMSVLAFCEVLEIWQSPFCSPDLLAIRLCFLFFFFCRICHLCLSRVGNLVPFIVIFATCSSVTVKNKSIQSVMLVSMQSSSDTRSQGVRSMASFNLCRSAWDWTLVWLLEASYGY